MSGKGSTPTFSGNKPVIKKVGVVLVICTFIAEQKFFAAVVANEAYSEVRYANYLLSSLFTYKSIIRSKKKNFLHHLFFSTFFGFNKMSRFMAYFVINSHFTQIYFIFFIFSIFSRFHALLQCECQLCNIFPFCVEHNSYIHEIIIILWKFIKNLPLL